MYVHMSNVPVPWQCWLAQAPVVPAPLPASSATKKTQSAPNCYHIIALAGDFSLSQETILIRRRPFWVLCVVEN